MPTTRVIRVDNQVWLELKKRAIPFEDTPNSVIRRVLGLPDEEDTNADSVDPRVTELLGAVRKLIGKETHISVDEHGYGFRSKAWDVVAQIRCQARQLRITASKRLVETVGITDWDNEILKSKFFNGSTVRWYLPNKDATASERVANVLAILWRGDNRST